MEPIPYFSSFANGGTLNGLDGDSYVIEAQEKNGSSAKFVKWPKQVANDVTREFVLRMIDRKYSDEEICELAKISEDQLTAYKTEYDKMKSE